MMLSNRRYALVGRLMVLTLSFEEAGHTLDDLGYPNMTALATPVYALFRATEDELIDAIIVLRETLSKIGVRVLTQQQAISLLEKRLDALRVRIMRQALETVE